MTGIKEPKLRKQTPWAHGMSVKNGHPACRRALQQLHEGTSQISVIKRTQTSPAANTKKFVGATTGFVACKNGGFWQTVLTHFVRSGPTPRLPVTSSPTKPQSSASPFRRTRDRSNCCPETSGSPAGEPRQTQQGDGADKKVCSRRAGDTEKRKLGSEDKRERWLSDNWQQGK